MSLLNIYILDLVMIKLFDFKFLILLTLAIVIYFMYKDMDEQRDRIQKLEDAYRAHLHDEKYEEKQEDNPQPKNIDQPKNAQEPKIISPVINNLKLELPNKMIYKTEVIKQEKIPLPVCLEKDEEGKDEEEKKDDEEEDEDNDSEDDSSSTYLSKKSILEIYSNDNDNLEETSISNSLVENKEIINVSENLEDILNNLEIEINADTTKYESNNLVKLKVSELQDLAKKENISIDKKVNGSNKKKTKQELIDELCSK